MSNNVDQLAINTIRVLACDQVQAANSGHPGMPLGMAAVGYVLWKEYLNLDPSDPKWLGRDRFVLSNGHGCALLYSLLHLYGFQDVSLDQLKKFRQIGSLTPGHPESHLTPGVDVTTGPLGQGISNAVGFAMAQAHLAARFSPEVADHYTYVFCGDGCLMEGISQEACSLAGHLGLGRLIVIWDDNQISIDGSTSLAFTEDVGARYEALGWHVQTVEDGNSDLDAIRRAVENARAVTDKPSIIKLRTTIGYGSTLAGSHKVHGAPLGPDNLRALKSNFGFDPDRSFVVPDEVYETFRAATARGAAKHAEWRANVEAYIRANADKGRELQAFISGDLGSAWRDALPRYTPADKALATRQYSEICLNAVAKHLPTLVGGSADLTPSNLTEIKGGHDFQKHSYDGRYFRFGVREHGMAAISNGLAAYGGFIPYAATFLNFFGYAAGAVRVSAVAEHGVIFIGTHDSIGLGEDGPTHQPIEMLTMLRAMPHMTVIRPADGNETSGAYAIAIEHRHGPVSLALSRQALPNLEGSSVEGVARGAYPLTDHFDGAPEAILVSSGSEVSICVDAAKKSGKRVRVVSMPSWELFEAQDADYKRTVFPEGVPVLSVEAAATIGWDRYSHAQIGMKTFGASGSIKQLYDHFGLTADRVSHDVHALIDFYSRHPVPSLVDRPL